MADDKPLDALSAKVTALSEGLDKRIADAVTAALKPVLDAQAQAVANQKAAEETELVDLRAKIVKANLMDATAAGELTINAARALVKAATPGKAAALAAGFTPALIDDADGGFLPPKEA